MTKDTGCVDGFCPMMKPASTKDPKDVFFAPVDEEVKPAKTSPREKFISFCDDNPNDVECRLFDV